MISAIIIDHLNFAKRRALVDTRIMKFGNDHCETLGPSTHLAFIESAA